MSVTKVWVVDPEGSERALAGVRETLQRDSAAHCLALYFAPTLASIANIEEWCALKDLHVARLQLHFTIRDEPQELPIAAGALEAAKLTELMDAFASGAGRDSVHFAVSAASEAALREAAVASLTAADVARPASDGICQVTLTLDGRTRHFGVEEGETVLEAGERAGLTLPFSCRSAVCATCRTRVTSGTVEMAQNYALEPWEVEAGFILACQSRPTSPQLGITYDER